MKLYINGYEIEQYKDTIIAQTLQVNTIADLNTRQASYTDVFKVPKTANNVRAFRYLSLPGNTADIQYKKNECSLYNETGECFVYKGWAKISDAGKDYEVAIQDGITDLFKAFANLNLSDLGLEELTHQKSVQNVKNSWSAELPYMYILADYNGDTGLANSTDTNAIPEVNVDYLVPSVSIKWLWDKLWDKLNQISEDSFGFKYSGNVFDTANFKDLYMTYPKGQVVSEEDDLLVFSGTDVSFLNVNEERDYHIKFNTVTTNLTQSLINNTHIKIAETGAYRIKVSGKLKSIWYTYISPKDGNIAVMRNQENLDSWDEFAELQDEIPNNTEFETEPVILRLQANDEITIFAQAAKHYDHNDIYFSENDSNILVELYQLQPSTVDFATAFSNFTVKDFLMEVLYRFGLTMYKSKYPDNDGFYTYEFLTMRELLSQSNAIDWSDKFLEKTGESYTYSNYAKNNWFRMKYNDKEATYYDGNLRLNNYYLSESKDVLKSKIYAPEKEQVKYLDKDYTNVYKMWEKNIVEITEEDTEGNTEDNTEGNQQRVDYKDLDGRYYLIKPRQESKQIKLMSGMLSQEQPASQYYRESFYKLSLSDVISEYYSSMLSILDHALIVEAEFWLTEADIANFDFTRKYYIKQLSKYFIVNKINSYVPGKKTKVELIRVLYGNTPTAREFSVIDISNTTYQGGNVYKVDYQAFYQPVEGVIFRFETSADQTEWTDIPNAATTQYSGAQFVNLAGYPTGYIRIVDDNNSITSNVMPLQ